MKFAENGFEIHEQSAGLVLIDRRIWGLAYAAISLAAAGLACLVLALLAYAELAGFRVSAPEYTFLLSGLALLLPEPFLLRAIRERKQASIEEIERFLFLDLASRELRDRMGAALAGFDDLELAMRIDWMTRGWGRLLTLSWPGRSRTVFRTLRRGRAVDALAYLAEKGIPTR